MGSTSPVAATAPATKPQAAGQIAAETDLLAGPQPLPRLVALAAAGSLIASLGLREFAILPAEVAGGLAVGVALLGWRAVGPAALAATLPVVGLLPFTGGSIGSFAGWSCAAIGMAAAGALASGEQLRESTRELRHQLVLAERERERMRTTVNRYPSLQEACLSLSAVRDMDHLAQILCQEVRTLMPSALRVRVHAGVAQQLACRASSDLNGQPCARTPGDDERYVATESRLLTRRDGHDLRVLLPLRGERRSEHGREVLCGVLDVTLATHEADDQLQLELMQALAQLGGIGLAAVDLVGQARSLALRDDLTGLFGQHEFLRRLEEQVATTRRNDQNLGVVMCDLDYLKRFNDTWGHAAGDIALKAVATAIRSVIDHLPGAVACRYGGEEFALCIPGKQLAELQSITEQLRAAIAAAMPDPSHPERQVTASMGVATVRQQENGRGALIRADAACYRAKAQGRNRVSMADDLGSVDVSTVILPQVASSGVTR